MSAATAVTRRIAGASLSPLSASMEAASRRGSGRRRRAANTAAASVELMTAASSRANPQRRAQQPDGDRGGHPDADPDADGGQGDPRPDRPPHVRPPGGQPTLGQDDDQRGDAEVLGELGVLELDAEAALPQREAQRQVQQEAGQPEPVGHPERHGRDEHDDRPDRQGDGDGGVHRRSPHGAVFRAERPTPSARAERCRRPSGRAGGRPPARAEVSGSPPENVDGAPPEASGSPPEVCLGVRGEWRA